ncbi:Alpha/Beta hydrolase protein [Halteromyces radiatus]|uniref:Alpha/Beta hydrolase protein n=1 Tax=Halteromyces radiatus TaxID=101107 RepID=UPI00222125B9|nr:Alpha/Beta hydrolase protein [Halteromyces radiatus]KAI8096773.1 Alpha/Beta hydrolase protein [Halteromyces radiatus]
MYTLFYFLLSISLFYFYFYVIPFFPVEWRLHWIITRSPLNDSPTYSVRIKESWTCEHLLQYSGYVDLLDDHFFFIFNPSQDNPFKDSTILWLNGGPGCSSLMDAWAGIGPCHITEYSNETVRNPYTWNKHNNILFLDQPIGTGFSYGRSKTATSSEAAKQVYTFLQVFFNALPQYIPTSLILAGESYAGKYLPALSGEILFQNEQLDQGKQNGIRLALKSIIIGNGWTEPKTQLVNFHTFGCDDDNEYKPLFDARTCTSMKSSAPRCQSLMEICYKYPTKWGCIPGSLYCQYTQLSPYDATGLNTMDIRKRCVDKNYCYWIEHSLEIYANNQDVRSSLGVDNQVPPFQYCRSSINERFLFAMDPVLDHSPFISEALNQGIAVLLYAGDMDWICNWKGNKAWALALEWNGKQGFNMAMDRELYTDTSEKPTGQVRSFDKLTFLRVFDAGHMAVIDQPMVIQEFVTQKWMKE